MIKSILIKNFVLIDELEINFDKGLNILTGETGSGKSILIDAIDLVFGARASKDQIKTGASKALIELTLELSSGFPLETLAENAIDVEDDSILVISREISASSTRSRINGVMVTQSYIQSLREYLIDIHSQNETYNYAQPKTHIVLLDNYGGEAHSGLIEKFNAVYAEHKKTLKDYESAVSQTESSEQKIDFLKYQIEEIESAKIDDAEEYTRLVEEREILVNIEDLKEYTLSSYSALYGEDNSVIDVLNDLERKLIRASEFDKNLADVADVIASSAINLKDASDELRDYAENLESDPENLSFIEERIMVLDKLKRKYGPELSDVIENFEKYKLELSEISFTSEHVDDLHKKLQSLEGELKQAAEKLSISRQKLAESLSNLIQIELVKLEMPRAKFKIAVDAKNEISSNGMDNVEFLIAANAGEPLRSLIKVASGGEISRVMLAIKTVFAKIDNVNTVIFDEIDTGISGKTSQVIGEELSNLGMSHQVLCITHQPIIAAMADSHFYIQKVQNADNAVVTVDKLTEQERTEALSRLASGSCDADSMNFAQNLIKQAQDFKKSGMVG